MENPYCVPQRKPGSSPGTKAGTEATGSTKPKKPKGNKRFNEGFERGILFVCLLLKWSGTGPEIGSGKLGGTVFLKGGASGPSARVLAFPRNRRSGPQQYVRGLFSGISTAFRALTAAQIDAWNQAANNTNATALRVNVFGDQKVVSGAQLWQRVTNILIQLGLPPYTTPPVAGTTESILAATLVADSVAPAMTLDLTLFGGGAALPANTYLIVQGTSQRSASVSSFGKSQYRAFGVYDPAEVIPVDIEADYIAKFGALIAGSRVGVRARLVFDDGAGTFSLGGWVYAQAIVS